ncbi:hypothetical protein BDZ88DRAFT_407043 [Geranomyces variabilis]|nr:hypothetical protein BDZ88DRAFT_407043 [Geranomyces variabilis]
MVADSRFLGLLSLLTRESGHVIALLPVHAYAIRGCGRHYRLRARRIKVLRRRRSGGRRIPHTALGRRQTHFRQPGIVLRCALHSAAPDKAHGEQRENGETENDAAYDHVERDFRLRALDGRVNHGRLGGCDGGRGDEEHSAELWRRHDD